MSDANLTPADYQLLEQWQLASNALAEVKANELTLRQQVEAAFFNDAGKGTHYIPLANDHKLKHVGKINYKLDAENLPAALDTIENSSNDGHIIADRLVKWTPTLSVSEYEKLSDAHRRIIDRVMTTSPGACTLEIVEPKGKR